MGRFDYLAAAELSDVGRKRSSNEDATLMLTAQGVFCVADGMGGAACGEIASQWLVEAVRATFTEDNELGLLKADRMREAINSASYRIHTMAEEEGYSGMGTTVVALFFDDDHPAWASILHAGDSRAYRLRRGLLECLTVDHSMVTTASVRGQSTPALYHGMITRAVGVHTTVDLEETPVEIEPGDIYMLCSDGLTGMLPDAKLRQLLQWAPETDLDLVARHLIEAACDAGGDDNISVLLIRVGHEIPAPRRLEAVQRDFLADFGFAEPPADEPLLGQGPLPIAPRPSPALSEAFEATTPLTAAEPEIAEAPDDILPVTPAPTPTVPELSNPAWADDTPREIPTATPATPPTPESTWNALAEEHPEPPPALEPDPAPLTPDEWQNAAEPAAPMASDQDNAPPDPLPEPASRITLPTPLPAPVAGTLPTPKDAAVPAREIPHRPAVTLASAPAARRRSTGWLIKVGVTVVLLTLITLFLLQRRGADLAEPQPTATEAPTPTLVESSIGAALPDALAYGSWGEISRILGTLPEGTAVQIPDLERIRVWVQEWRQATDTEAYAQRQTARYYARVAPVLSAMGAALPPQPVYAGLPAAQRANRYCAALMELRASLMQAAEGYLETLNTEIGTLGQDPRAALALLSRQSGQPAPMATFDAWERGLIQLEGWLENELQVPVPLLGIMRGPASLVPEIETQRAAFWNVLKAMASTVTPPAQPAEAAALQTLTQTILARP